MLVKVALTPPIVTVLVTDVFALAEAVWRICTVSAFFTVPATLV